MSKLFSLLLIFLALPYSPEKEMENESSACKLSIEFTNFRTKKGVLYIFIYNYANQYPDNPFKYYVIDKSNIRTDRLLVNISDLNKGMYAISIFDDENNNEDMDYFLGLPTEGFAFSNNVRPFFSLPDFEDILIELIESHEKMRLKLRYVL